MTWRISNRSKLFPIFKCLIQNTFASQLRYGAPKLVFVLICRKRGALHQICFLRYGIWFFGGILLILTNFFFRVKIYIILILKHIGWIQISLLSESCLSNLMISLILISGILIQFLDCFHAWTILHTTTILFCHFSGWNQPRIQHLIVYLNSIFCL